MRSRPATTSAARTARRAPSCTARSMPQRDQSYFLFATTRGAARLPALSAGRAREARDPGAGRALRPRGRRQARQPGHLLRAEGSYTRVVERLRPDAAEPGEIVHVDGRVLGRHDGLMGFTVGQRRGLAVATGERLYVVRLEPERRRVVVGPKSALACARGRAVRASTGWATSRCRRTASQLEVKHRAREPAGRGPRRGRRRRRRPGRVREPQAGVAPGQACVFYQGTRVLGGGWIERTREAWPQA